MGQRAWSKFELIPIQIVFITIILLMASISSHPSLLSKRMFKRSKRSFAQLRCLGVYDRSKFANLNHICDECYQLYRDQNIHLSCRQDCFQSDTFDGCVEALLLSHEQKKLKEMISLLNGKK